VLPPSLLFIICAMHHPCLLPEPQPHFPDSLTEMGTVTGVGAAVGANTGIDAGAGTGAEAEAETEAGGTEAAMEESNNEIDADAECIVIVVDCARECGCEDADLRDCNYNYNPSNLNGGAPPVAP